MDFQDLVDTPRKIKTLVGTIAFLVAFPVYFAIMPSLIGETGPGGFSSSSGSWSVAFEEDIVSLSETVNLEDGETYESIFEVLESDSSVSIGFVEIVVSCNDNDDPGPGFTDSADGNSDLSGVSGDFSDQSASGNCGGGDSGFSMRWDVTPNYSGEGYEVEGTSISEIESQWDDGGFGIGEWFVGITADISSPPGPVIGDIIDSDEDFDITWNVVYYELVITPVFDIA